MNYRLYTCFMVNIFLFLPLFALEEGLSVYVGGCVIDAPDKGQDRMSMQVLSYDAKEIALAGVYDGHGTNGSLAAQTVKDTINNNMSTMIRNLNSVSYAEFSAIDCLAEAINQAQMALSSSKMFYLSGTTAVNACVYDGVLCLANVGDSRAVIGLYNDNGNISAYQPLEDHCCDNAREIERIENEGASVKLRGCSTHYKKNQYFRSPWTCPESDDSDKACFYIKCVIDNSEDSFSGYRYTRSLGDARSSLILSEPETFEVALNPDKDRFVILASDGVWEESIESPITNQEAVEIVQKQLDIYGYSDESAALAAKTLANIAQGRWGGDDIAVVVLVFDWKE